MKHIKIIQKIFNLDKKKINGNDKVDKYNWDSITKINLINAVDDKFSKILDHKKIEKIIYIKDIDELIKKIADK
jgi:acyl carrier protein